MEFYMYIFFLMVLIATINLFLLTLIDYLILKRKKQKNIALQKKLADADKYISDNKDNLIDVKSDDFSNCCIFGKNLMYGWENYDKIIKKYELNKTIQCSNSVVSGAQNDNIKYLFKYSKLKYSAECVKDINFCCDYVEDIASFRTAFNNLTLNMRSVVPESISFYVNREKINDIVVEKCNIDRFVLNINIPEFEFYYSSSKGKSVNNCRILLTYDFLIKLKEILIDEIDTDNYIKRQRRAMTKDLREAIKKRDNYTCCICGNSVYNEPNLLLEVDHIIPISKGGKTQADNLQTLCWKCNRNKGDKQFAKCISRDSWNVNNVLLETHND